MALVQDRQREREREGEMGLSERCMCQVAFHARDSLTAQVNCERDCAGTSSCECA